MDRIIGQYGGIPPGPLVVAIGGLHGNEPAGVQALTEIFQMLEQEAVVRPDFEFRGKFIGLVGHLQAFQRGLRFINEDLNRIWLPDKVEKILAENPQDLYDEPLEIRELYTNICQAIQTALPTTLVLLDLHTTSAGGGIFCIPSDETDGVALYRDLHAPVILGLFEGLHGTLLRFATEGGFAQGGFPLRTFGAAFEAGQHEDPASVSRSVAAIVHALRVLDCIDENALDSRHHDDVLRQSGEHLPQVTRLEHIHPIAPEDHFKMRPGYNNFQLVQQGEILADDTNGLVVSPSDGLILMPLYQPQGTDGFFIVREV
ncbi:MAG: succinylglutamate desuccinylase/aspartoacylase family protein [Saprospiraceae bacterium]|nr:succinylglutamate desuccinylase/aspartoacylase family protein [Saprospiraceae bacterium]